MMRYVKQAWALLWQNKLYGSLYLLGTAVPVVLTMIVVMYFHILTASIYPEKHRQDLSILRTVVLYDDQGNQGQGSCSASMLREWFYSLRSAEAATGIYYYDFNLDDRVQLTDGVTEMKVKTKYTDPNFFRVFDFQFLSGASFTQGDMDASHRCAVLSSSMARRLFGTDQATGKYFTMNYNSYKVAGVVRDASSVTPLSFAQIWLPYTCLSCYDMYQNTPIGTGPFQIVVRTRNGEETKQMQAELNDHVRRFNAMQSNGQKIDLYGPIPVWQRNLQQGNQKVDLYSILRIWGALLLTFLIVPAMNLGGMISSRMEMRLGELGVSKAFGAGNGFLLRQVFRENLIMTLIGGLIGLCVSWLILYWGHDWVIGLFDTYGLMYAETQEMLITPAMLFSPILFVIALLFCILLNLTSALIPAWHAMRVPIVQALGEKK